LKSNRKLEVVDWINTRPPEITSRPSRHSRVSPGVLGLVGTLLLHTFALQSFILGTSARTVRIPEIQGLGASSVAAGADSEMTLVLVQPTEAAVPKESLFEEFASKGSAPKNLPIVLISPDPAPAFDLKVEQQNDDKDSDAAVASGDPAGRARLFGIYSGQIQARIERAWRRPRTPVHDASDLRHADKGTAATFRCQVQIIQDPTGKVQEILLPNCNGSVAWQRSLVIAIQQSSPLPAPPDPTVFSNAITLNFIGFAYATGSSADDYEIEPHKMAQVTESIRQFPVDEPRIEPPPTEDGIDAPSPGPIPEVPPEP
jgi:hypothetical protein